jgi:hypothetical protein
MFISVSQYDFLAGLVVLGFKLQIALQKSRFTGLSELKDLSGQIWSSSKYKMTDLSYSKTHGPHTIKKGTLPVNLWHCPSTKFSSQ